MSISILQRQASALIISALLTFPSLATAQEKEPATATSSQSSQSEGMDKMNHGNMDHKGMNHGEMGHKEMMDKKGGMKNKAAGKTPPNVTNDTPSTSQPMETDQHGNSDSPMPMNNDM